ncbi:MAG: coenzyme F420-0:L-glutamate ligase [Candidatus Thorarchaeota archaeon]
MVNARTLQLLSIPDIPEIEEGMNLSTIIWKSLEAAGIPLTHKDILVIAHSVVSKAEGRVVYRKDVEISEEAKAISEKNGFDPAHVELAIREARSVVRTDGVLITETHHGFVCNFSGVDKSNAPPGSFILLPEDPDRSALVIQRNLEKISGLRLAVVISDTQGRPWRHGAINVALGCAGINAFKYNRGKRDLHGRELQYSTVCQIDELASAAEPLMGQANEGTPVVIVRGYDYESGDDTARSINRTKDEDLFR